LCRTFFSNDPATPEFYTLSLHDALPISRPCCARVSSSGNRGTTLTRQSALPNPWPLMRYVRCPRRRRICCAPRGVGTWIQVPTRSEEHTSELQSRENLVCRLLLEKKKYG